MPFSLRRVGAVVACAVAGLAALGTSTGAAGPARAADPAAPPAVEGPSFTFVSSPDLFNADVGDLRTAGIKVTGGRNSWNASYAEAVDRVLSALVSNDADAYLVAGDLVEGHWGQDHDRTGYFGPVATRAQRSRAVGRAGDFYYGRFRGFFDRFGVDAADVYPAVGDHEIGDNPWPRGGDKAALVPAYKAAWARSFTRHGRAGHRFADRPVGTPFEDTSYATWLTPKGPHGVLLVTVDVFRAGRDGVTATVTGKHLAWLRGVLASAPASATVIVQGHVPALTPVRSRGSSLMSLEGGRTNPFWRAMDRSGKVDLYLAGEVHAQTVRREGRGTLQVTHGGLFAYYGTAYVVGKVYDDRVELVSYQLRNHYDKRTELWALSTKRSPATLSYDAPVRTGSLVLHRDGTVEAAGELTVNPDLSDRPRGRLLLTRP